MIYVKSILVYSYITLVLFDLVYLTKLKTIFKGLLEIIAKISQ